MALFDGIRSWFQNVFTEAGYGDDPLNRDEAAGWQPGDIFGRILGDVRDYFTNFRSDQIALEENELARETFDYNQWLNQEQMEREDTAAQRRVADLRAAGLSPTLAPGSSAGSSGGALLSAPKLARPSRAEAMRESSAQMMALMKMAADVSKTQADTEAVRVQTSRARHDLGIAQQLDPARVTQEAVKAWLAEHTRDMEYVRRGNEANIVAYRRSMTEQESILYARRYEELYPNVAGLVASEVRQAAASADLTSQQAIRTEILQSMDKAELEQLERNMVIWQKLGLASTWNSPQMAAGGTMAGAFQDMLNGIQSWLGGKR